MIITLEGNPPRKDDHWTIANPRDRRAGMTLTKNGRTFRRRVREEVRAALKAGQNFPEGPLFAVRIVMYVKLWSHVYNCPKRDIDSAISPIFDALEHAGVFENDVQVEHLYPPRRFKDAQNPRTVIEVTHWSPESQEG